LAVTLDRVGGQGSEEPSNDEKKEALNAESCKAVAAREHSRALSTPAVRRRERTLEVASIAPQRQVPR
jgi:hypothetical protein